MTSWNYVFDDDDVFEEFNLEFRARSLQKVSASRRAPTGKTVRRREDDVLQP